MKILLRFKLYSAVAFCVPVFIYLLQASYLCYAQSVIIWQKIDDGKPYLRADFRDDSGSPGDAKSSASAEAAKGSGDPGSSDLGNDSDDCKSSHIEKGNSVSEEAVKCSLEIAEIPESNSKESNVTSSEEKPPSVEDVEIDLTCKRSSGSQSMDVYLNIRLPNSVSLQHKFSVTSTLRVVKEYVDDNQDGNINSYNLAIPYPRKVFTDQGMIVQSFLMHFAILSNLL